MSREIDASATSCAVPAFEGATASVKMRPPVSDHDLVIGQREVL
jgi:hypothetical protein